MQKSVFNCLWFSRKNDIKSQRLKSKPPDTFGPKKCSKTNRIFLFFVKTRLELSVKMTYLALGTLKSLKDFSLIFSLAIEPECLSVSAWTRQSGEKQSSSELMIRIISVVCPPEPKTATVRTFFEPRFAFRSTGLPRRYKMVTSR